MKKIIMAILVFGLMVSVAWGAVQISAVKPVDDTKNWIYLTLTVDGDEVRYVSVNPWNTSGPPLIGQALQDWCDNREPWFAINILKQMYEGARYQSSEGDTDLAKFQAWIAAGCENPDGTVITKVPWVDSWSATKVQAENAMKTSILYNKSDAQIQAYIQANVPLDPAAQLFLYRLTKEIRDIERRLEMD